MEKAFVKEVIRYYTQNARELPWRFPDANGSFNPYKILVSEIMLQQTQVQRVIPKYMEFLKAYPDVQSLAQASLGDVLRLWSGLGYNRRAKFLWQAAQMVVTEYDGIFPTGQAELTRLPGVGVNTAGAICAYAYKQRVVFIETNIRTVFINHFFKNRIDVHDSNLRPLLEQALKEAQAQGLSPREWYWALMDYGTHLKATVGNASRASKHYAKQSAFTGSKRQVRGKVLRELADSAKTMQQLSEAIGDERLPLVLEDLLREGLIVQKKSRFGLE